MANQVYEQRDRFLAFAFAAADVLIEVNGEGIIIFAAGAVYQSLGIHSDALEGMPFDHLFLPNHASMVQNLLQLASSGNRIGPQLFALAPNAPIKNVAVSAFSLPERRYVTNVTLSSRMTAIIAPGERDGETGLLTADSFTNILHQIIVQFEKTQQSLTVIFAHLFSRDKASATELVRKRVEVATELRKLALEDAAARLSTNIISVFSNQVLDYTNISQLLSNVAGPAFSVSVEMLPIHAHYHPRDAERMIAYAIKEARNANDKPLDFSAVQAAIGNRVQRTDDQLSQFERELASGEITLVGCPVVSFVDHDVQRLDVRFLTKNMPSPVDQRALLNVAHDASVFDLKVLSMAIHHLSIMPKDYLSIRVSMSSFLRSKFRQGIMQAVGMLSCNIKHLVVELVDIHDVDNIDQCIETILSFTSAGIVFHFADIDVHQPLLSLLMKLKPDAIHLSASCTHNIMASSYEASLIQGIVTLAQTVGACVVAESVSDFSTIEMLTELGIHQGAGSVFGEPIALKYAAP